MTNLDWKQSMFYGYNLTEEQEKYVRSIFTNRLTMSDSVAGSGKTTLAVLCADYMRKKILYLFSPVEEKQMGFRPGTQATKDRAYIGPLEDAVCELKQNPMQAIKMGNAEEGDVYDKTGKAWITAMSHIFLRGRNIGKDGDLLVIIDEAQNWTKSELKKTLSRIHDAAIVVVIGHNGQCDLPNPAHSGFPRVLEVYGNRHYAEICNLTKNFRGELSRDAELI